MEGPVSHTSWCLFLDVDGTLLEIATTPDAVRVDTELNDLLSRVGASLNGAMALVSGRSISELDRLFAPRRWPAAGIHGLERRDAAGAVHRAVEDDPQLEIARHELGRLTQRLPGTILEDKGLTLAVHYRRAPQCEEELRTAVLALARRCGSGFDVLEGRKVLELRPVGATKAHAIREFLAEPPFLGRRPIFLGDDITDASGLDEVERRGGLSVAVGDRVRGMVRVDGPREVRIFLAGLARNGSPPT